MEKPAENLPSSLVLVLSWEMIREIIEVNLVSLKLPAHYVRIAYCTNLGVSRHIICGYGHQEKGMYRKLG